MTRRRPRSTTEALTSWTASWEAMTTAVVWIGSILLWSTSITALLPASTWANGSSGNTTTTSRSSSSSAARAAASSVGVPARVDEALEHVVVLGDGVLVERVRRADEHGPQPEALAAVPGAEEHQERERAEDEEQDQPRLAHDLGELLAHERRTSG